MKIITALHGIDGCAWIREDQVMVRPVIRSAHSDDRRLLARRKLRAQQCEHENRQTRKRARE
jgi:hypothetical protein